MKTLHSLLVSLRPQQWIKNAFVFAALVFSEQLSNRASVLDTLEAFLLFCALASSVYLINDVVDYQRDREHPEKSKRPIASGALPRPLAVGIALILGLGAIVGSYALARDFGTIAVVYIVLNIAYTFALKKIAIVEAIVLASFYVLRAIAGAAVIGVTISSWLLICTLLLSLFLAFGKRRHEFVVLGDNAGQHRKILQDYSPQLLDQMIAIVTSATVVAYILYTVSPEVVDRFHTTHLVYTVPFVLYGIFRYLTLIHLRGQGGSPARVSLTDGPLIINNSLWLLTVIGILYAKV